MVAVPISKPAKESPTTPDAVESETMNWIAFAASGTLVASGLLLLAGEQQTLRQWWEALPGHIDQVQNVLNKVQDTVNEVAAKREDLHRILAR
jgi:ABC-type transporter Mla subunit MlaD